MVIVLGVLLLLLIAAAAWLHAEKGWFRPTPHQWIVGHMENLLAYAAAMTIVAIPTALVGAVAAHVAAVAEAWLQRGTLFVFATRPVGRWKATLRTESPRAKVDEVFEFVVGDCDLEIIDETPVAAPAAVAAALAVAMAYLSMSGGKRK